AFTGASSSASSGRMNSPSLKSYSDQPLSSPGTMAVSCTTWSGPTSPRGTPASTMLKCHVYSWPPARVRTGAIRKLRGTNTGGGVTGKMKNGSGGIKGSADGGGGRMTCGGGGGGENVVVTTLKLLSVESNPAGSVMAMIASYCG